MTKSQTTRVAPNSRLLAWSLLFLVISALALGGQARGNPFLELLIQSVSIVVGFAILTTDGPRPDAVRRAASLVIIGVLCLFAFQLIPLPYDIWAAINPVDTAEEVLGGLGLDGGWRPLSLVPHETFANLLLLLPAFAAFYATLRLGERYKQHLLVAVLVMAALSVLLGFLQYASKGASSYLYEDTHRGYATGIFSNRNHQADLAIIGLLASFALLESTKRKYKSLNVMQQNLLLLSSALFFGVGILSTGSRMGFLLGGFAGAAILLNRIGRFGARAMVGLVALISAVAGLFAVGTLTGSRLFGATVSRFDTDSDMRLEIWPEVLRMIPDTLPFGSGIGSFATYYRYGEPLEKIGPRFINSAHNEYLEIAIEAGVPGILLTVAGIMVIAWGGWKVVRTDQRIGNATNGANYALLVGIVVLLLHSTFDYPLRTTGLAVVFATLCGLILGQRSDTFSAISQGSQRRSDGVA